MVARVYVYSDRVEMAHGARGRKAAAAGQWTVVGVVQEA
jgi:hypothetical protein